MTTKKLILYLVATLLLSRAWFLFSDEHQFMIDFWASVGLDITKKYNLYLFSDNLDRLKWYAYDCGYLLSFMIMTYIIKCLIRNRHIKTVATVFYYFAIFRVVEYWTFRFSIGLTAITFGIILYSLARTYGRYSNV